MLQTKKLKQTALSLPFWGTHICGASQLLSSLTCCLTMTIHHCRRCSEPNSEVDRVHPIHSTYAWYGNVDHRKKSHLHFQIKQFSLLDICIHYIRKIPDAKWTNNYFQQDGAATEVDATCMICRRTFTTSWLLLSLCQLKTIREHCHLNASPRLFIVERYERYHIVVLYDLSLQPSVHMCHEEH